jgi:pimeloyl-ACP methyl ester carboxylesterase
MQQIILLHGALGSAVQFEPLEQLLKENFEVHNINLPGHGGEPMPENGFSINNFAQFVIDYIEKHQLSQVTLFGYSMGGYVAMNVAHKSPEKIKQVITIGTKYHWDPETAQREVKMLDPEQTLAKVPAFAQSLGKRHAPNDWKTTMRNTAAMLIGLGNDNALKLADYSAINTPCLLIIGDRDKMISIEETTAVYRSLPNAQLAVMPNTPHLIEKVNIQLLYSLIPR